MFFEYVVTGYCSNVVDFLKKKRIRDILLNIRSKLLERYLSEVYIKTLRSLKAKSVVYWFLKYLINFQ